MPSFSESIVEQATLEWFEALGYSILNASEVRAGLQTRPYQTRPYDDVVLRDRLQNALVTINPDIPADAIEDAIRKVTQTETPSLYENNRRFHKFLTDGVDVEYQADGYTKYDKVWLIDFHKPENNNWLAVNQFIVIENKNNRRPDVVVFINGLPIAVIELKNPVEENATIKGAFNQLQTYKKEIPCLFPYNEILVVSDGTEARVGTLTADWERFMPWRTIDGQKIAPRVRAGLGDRSVDSTDKLSTKPAPTLELETLIKGIFPKDRILDLLRYFIIFETDSDSIVKKMAGYHQYHAVNKAIAATVKATDAEGDRKVGVVWHTQGSGKSLTMAFYAGKIVQHPALSNPTLVVLTDRNDLDDQLFNTFSNCADLLRQTPVQADDRKHLRDLLQVASGGIVFTTIQKFSPEPREEYPQLSDRRNIVFIADEAHRSQYGLNARVVVKSTPEVKTDNVYPIGKRRKSSLKAASTSSSYQVGEAEEKEAYISYGFAKYLRDALPNASFIGFTRTPIEATDKNTPAVFGDYIDIYDIQRAVEDEATVKIYYEGRLAKIELEESQRPLIDSEFEDLTEDEESSTKEQLKSRWARLEALVGAEERVNLIAQDIVTHFENRQSSLDGKAMIVCMSRRICVELYKAIVTLRPDWHHDDDDKGVVKVVMTGSAADDPAMQPHIRNKQRSRELAKRFKKTSDEMKLVIVRDMWLTGFDAPCLHTLYVDKPMKGHGLMQAIARVNRVFKDKPGGLIVDYLGIADQLKEALKDYTESDRGETGIPTETALAILQEKYEVVGAIYHGFDYSPFFTGSPSERLAVIPAAMDFVLGLEEDKSRYVKAVSELSKAFALVSSMDEAIAIRDEVGFFQAIKVAIGKHTTRDNKSAEDLNTAVRQIVSKAVASDEVIDIFAAAGLKNPDISILSDEFLEEVRGLPQKNLALEVLRKLLNDEIKMRSRKNLVQSRTFSEMLENTIKRYQNRSIEAAQVIAELIELAREIRQAQSRGEDLGLTDDEVAFYDALEVNDSAVLELGDATLKAIARDLVQAIRNNVTIDWTMKEGVRAKLRVTVKRLLKKYGYPPDKQEKATVTVLQQAELLCKDWIS
jgi:type I restriction enzyme R subunit